MSKISSLASLLVLLLFGSAPAAADGDRILTPEILVDLKLVSDVVLSPGADQVAYLLEVPRSAKEKPGLAHRELWTIHLEKGKPRRAAGEKERLSEPAFSPDGKRITFLAERKSVDPHTQIYLQRARGNAVAQPLTEHPSSIEQYRWSPDGRSIAFTAPDPETEEEKKNKETGLDFKVWDEDTKLMLLFLFDVKKRKSRQVETGELHVLDFVWAPDSRHLLLRAAPTPRVDDDYMRSKLYVAPTDAEASLFQLVETPGKLGEMEVSPDGRHLAFLGATSRNDPLAQSLFVVPIEGGLLSLAENLTEGYEGSCSELTWWDENTVLTKTVEGAHHVLYKISIEDGARHRLASPRHQETELLFNEIQLRRDQDLLALVAHAPGHPAELYLARADGSEARRAHSHNPKLAHLRLARQEVVRWTAADGMRINGVLTYPLDYEEGRRYPLVLQVHGGPEGVSLDGWTTTAVYPVQLLARDGFMVLEPNYRGSEGRGVAYSQADHNDLGGAEFADVLAGIDALVERGLVDPERVGSGGWSYGGYFSAWAATRHSERFRAAVVGAGIANWISFTGTTDIPNEMSAVHWNSWWYDHQELHWQRSPLAHLKKAQTPTLILFGEDDERVHPAQGLELYTGLRLREVPARFVVYPREGHGLDERAHQLDAIERVRRWFGEYLKVPRVTGIREPVD